MYMTQYFTAFKTIVTKELLRFLRIWVQTILPPVITTVLYFIIFGKLIGEQIGEMGGVQYIDYIVPGLILMTVISNSYANVVSSFYSSKFQRHVEEILIAPVPNFIILAGYVGGGVARGMIVGVVVTIVSMFFSDWQIHSYSITFLVFFLTSVLFSMAGFINAIYANSFDHISIVPTFILTPLTYLGGVFYSVTMLPEFWQTLTLVNPIFYMINAFRYGLLGTSDISLSVAFTIILIFIAILGFTSLRLLDKGVGIKQ